MTAPAAVTSGHGGTLGYSASSTDAAGPATTMASVADKPSPPATMIRRRSDAGQAGLIGHRALPPAAEARITTPANIAEEYSYIRMLPDDMLDWMRDTDDIGQIGAKLRAELEELTSSVCRALNDPKRLAILYALARGPHSVSALCEQLEISQSNISQHLSMLRDRGLVDTHRDGNRVIYNLRDRRVVDAIDLLRSVMNDELARRQALRH